MAKQPQVTEQTRANLRAAFWDLYETKPIDKITVREVTDRAGYNRATFYLHYHDVYEVLEEVEDLVLSDAETVVAGRLMKGETLDFSQHMGLLIKLTRNPDSIRYLKVLLGDHGDPAFVRRFRELVRPLIERFLLPAGKLDEQEQRVVSEFYLSGIVAAISAWFAEDDPMDVEQFINLVMNTVLAGCTKTADTGYDGAALAEPTLEATT